MRPYRKLNRSRGAGTRRKPDRRGSILPMAAAMLVVVFAFAAFTVDFGVITVAKGQMQNAADASAHAAMLELTDALAPGYAASQSTAAANARERAVEMVGRFRTADVNSTIADANRDVRLGRRSFDESSGLWVNEWGVQPILFGTAVADGVCCILTSRKSRSLLRERHCKLVNLQSRRSVDL
ncbi:MAG: hypothetical protein KDA96_20230 [Planctomycetaceae bacterium]|nr:hypothetical protein [Planctomycetaceae bacterium]